LLPLQSEALELVSFLPMQDVFLVLDIHHIPPEDTCGFQTGGLALTEPKLQLL